MKREVVRVGPRSTYFESWKAPTSVVIRWTRPLFFS